MFESTIKHIQTHFKIPVNDALLVKVSEGRNNLCAIESCPILGENAFTWQVEEQFTSVDVLHNEAQSCCRLKRIPQRLLDKNYESWKIENGIKF